MHDSNIIHDRRLRLESHLAVLTYLAAPESGLNRTQRLALDSAIHRQRYRLASEWFVAANYSASLCQLRQTNPRHLHALDRLKWVAKMVLSFARS